MSGYASVLRLNRGLDLRKALALTGGDKEMRIDKRSTGAGYLVPPITHLSCREQNQLDARLIPWHTSWHIPMNSEKGPPALSTTADTISIEVPDWA